jgi:hypothetical protein
MRDDLKINLATEGKYSSLELGALDYMAKYTLSRY